MDRPCTMPHKFVKQNKLQRSQVSRCQKFPKAYREIWVRTCTTTRRSLMRECTESQMKISSPFISRTLTNGSRSTMAMEALHARSSWNSAYTSASSSRKIGKRISPTRSEKRSFKLKNNGKKKETTAEAVLLLFSYMRESVMLPTLVIPALCSSVKEATSAIKSRKIINHRTPNNRKEW